MSIPAAEYVAPESNEYDGSTQTAAQAVGTGVLIGGLREWGADYAPILPWDDLLRVRAWQSARIGWGAK